MTFKGNLGQRLLKLILDEKETPAFEDATCSISLHSLVASAFSITNYLKNKGLRKHQKIVIYNDKSNIGYLLMLACNIMGIAYSNIDPKLPKDRKKNVLATLDPTEIFDLFNGPCREEIEKAAKLYDTISFPMCDFKNMVDSVETDTISYIMLTSGSTGAPKGVAVSHHSVGNFIDWSRQEFEIKRNSRLSGINQIYFDNSVFDFYCSIYNGACIVPVASDILLNSQTTTIFLSQKKITHWFSVPSYLNYCASMKSFTDSRLNSLRHIIFGGEAYPKSLLKKVFKVYGKRAQFYNVYGPTEATCMCSSYKVSKEDFLNSDELCPLGKISGNFEWLIANMDATGVGELILEGPQIANGYLNDNEKTSEKFEFSSSKTGVLKKSYRTGDLVKLNNKNYLMFVGRKDFQIKHMGYRIELEEIELQLLKYFKLTEVSVIYKKCTTELNGRIIAFIVPENSEMDKNSLNAFIMSLPKYMRPDEVKLLEKLPKTRNGKIDRMHLIESA